MELPIVISDAECNLYGILRYKDLASKLVILLPARTGTRIGPQRIFVDIAREIKKNNISSLCIELPPLGDSHLLINKRFEGSLIVRETNFYNFYLDKIINYITNNFDFKEITLLSISTGCIPILNYSLKKEFKRTILLSPNHLTLDSTLVNATNLKHYFYKLFQKQTWSKLIRFKLNYKNILENTFKISNKKKVNKIKTDNNYDESCKIEILNIFGENDSIRKECQLFWQNKNLYNYKEVIIKNADHSFFGWQVKQDLIEAVTKWLIVRS